MAGHVLPSVVSSFWEFSICPSCRLLTHSSKNIDPLSFKKLPICYNCMSDLRKKNLIVNCNNPLVQDMKTSPKRSKPRMKIFPVVPQSSWRVVYPPIDHQRSPVYVAKLIYHSLHSC